MPPVSHWMVTDPTTGRFISRKQVFGEVPVAEIDTNARFVNTQLNMIAYAMGERLAEAVVEAGEIIKRGIKENFDTEGAYFGEPWEQLRPRTVAEKESLGYGDEQMLVRDGNLRASLREAEESADTDAESILAYMAADVATLKIGSPDWRVHFFQLGTANMVARPVLGIAPRDVAKVLAVFEANVVEALSAGGRIGGRIAR